MVQWQGQKKGGTPPVIPCQGLVLSTLLSRRGRGPPPPICCLGSPCSRTKGMRQRVWDIQSWFLAELLGSVGWSCKCGGGSSRKGWIVGRGLCHCLPALCLTLG